MDETSDGLSIATWIWRLGMMCIMIKERIAFCAQVEGRRGEIFSVSPIALQSQCKEVTTEPSPTYCHSWPQRRSDHLNLETDRMRRDSETVIGGWYSTRHVALTPDAESSATAVSLTALMLRVHSPGADPRGRNISLLMEKSRILYPMTSVASAILTARRL